MDDVSTTAQTELAYVAIDRGPICHFLGHFGLPSKEDAVDAIQYFPHGHHDDRAFKSILRKPPGIKIASGPE